MTKEIVALDQLAVEIRFYSQQTAQNIVEVGKRLAKAKEQVAKGEWANWLKDNVEFTRQTANQFIRCAERFSSVTTSLHLNPSQMFELLALPADETETFIEQKAAEGNPVEDMTVKALRQEVKEWKDRATSQEEIIQVLHDKERAIRESHEEQLDEKNGLIENLQAENLELSNTAQYWEQKAKQKKAPAKSGEVEELRQQKAAAEEKARKLDHARGEAEGRVRELERQIAAMNTQTATVETSVEDEEIAVRFTALLGATRLALYDKNFPIDTLAAHWKNDRKEFSILQENVELLNRVLNGGNEG